MATRFRMSGRQVYRLIADEHLLIDMHSKTDTPFYALTPSGAMLWKTLDEWRSEEELVSALRERYGITEEQATADVREFVEQLDTIGALERSAEEA